MIEIADDRTLDPHARRVMIDTRKWIFSKMRPEKYGDYLKTEAETNVTINVANMLVMPQMPQDGKLKLPARNTPALPAPAIIDAEPESE